jgi:hypothetical protein
MVALALHLGAPRKGGDAMRRSDLRIMELLNGGDWACAYAEGGTLAQVCVELEPLVGAQLAPATRAVSDAIEADMGLATHRWVELARALRREAAGAAACAR